MWGLFFPTLVLYAVGLGPSLLRGVVCSQGSLAVGIAGEQLLLDVGPAHFISSLLLSILMSLLYNLNFWSSVQLVFRWFS